MIDCELDDFELEVLSVSLIEHFIEVSIICRWLELKWIAIQVKMLSHVRHFITLKDFSDCCLREHKHFIYMNEWSLKRFWPEMNICTTTVIVNRLSVHK